MIGQRGRAMRMQCCPTVLGGGNDATARHALADVVHRRDVDVVLREWPQLLNDMASVCRRLLQGYGRFIR